VDRFYGVTLVAQTTNPPLRPGRIYAGSYIYSLLTILYYNRLEAIVSGARVRWSPSCSCLLNSNHTADVLVLSLKKRTIIRKVLTKMYLRRNVEFLSYIFRLFTIFGQTTGVPARLNDVVVPVRGVVLLNHRSLRLYMV